MKIFKHGIYSHGVLINIHTDSRDFCNYLLSDPFLHAHISDLEILSNNYEQPDFEIIHKTSGKNTAYLTKQSIRIYTKIPDVVKFSQLIFLIIPIFELFYEKKGIYSISGAGISNDKHGLILLGGQRAGKSTLASILSINGGLNYWSDERILFNLDNGTFLGGNRMISLRKNITETKFFTRLLKNTPLHQSSSTDKIYYAPNTNKPHQVQLKYLCVVQINNIPLYSVKLTNLDIKLQLYNNITQTIRSCLNPIINLQYNTPSFDNNKLANNRLRKISNLIDSKNIEGYELNGSIGEIQKWIEKKLV